MAAPQPPPPPPSPPTADPQGMKDYYENAPQPPTPLPDDPPPTQAQQDAYNDAKSQYESDQDAYEQQAGPPPEPAPVSVPSAPGGGSGKPAARMGDMTSHGGSIVAGCPTVLIGNKPAARLTDMHTCPMVTGVVPHVGGPIIPATSTTVLIANMFAARVGDKATCVGPPDTIAMGEFTVLIG